MGNENNFENKESIKKPIEIKSPDFYLNKNYPNNRNETLKEIISNYIEGKADSFQNNNNLIEVDNLLTPKFNTKYNFKKLDKFSIFTNEKLTNIEEEEPNIKLSNNNQKNNNIFNIINKNEVKSNSENNNQETKNIENNIINNNNQVVETGINNKNININSIRLI